MIEIVEGKLWEELLGVSEKKGIPLLSMIELTRKCNLNCIHCYLPNEHIPFEDSMSYKRDKCELSRAEVPREARGKRVDNELNTVEIKKVINELAEAGCLFLILSGGEIFLRQDIWKIIEHVNKKKFAYQIFTNGTFITEKIVKKLKELNPWEIGVSLYGMKPEIHDGITNIKGSFQKTINGIEILKKHDIPLSIKCVTMKNNFDNYREIISFAEKLKINFHLDFMLSPKLDGDRTPLHQKLENEKWETIISDKQVFPTLDAPESSKNDNILCQAGKNSCSITSCGDVFPCIALPIAAGNIRESSFMEIWQNSEILKKLRKMTEDEIVPCKNCSLVGYCIRCPGQAYLDDGNLYGPDYDACKVAQIREKIVNKNVHDVSQIHHG